MSDDRGFLLDAVNSLRGERDVARRALAAQRYQESRADLAEEELARLRSALWGLLNERPGLTAFIVGREQVGECKVVLKSELAALVKGERA